jgi:hypothetical protein
MSGSDSEEKGTDASRVGVLAAWIRPRAEILAAVSGLTIATAGAVAWCVAHFATEAELKRLACTSQLSLEQKALPLNSSIAEMQIERRRIELRELRNAQPPDQNKIDDLLDIIKDLRETKKTADVKFQEAIAAAPLKCQVE